MHEDNFSGMEEKQNSCDASREARADFPQALTQVANQRHSQRPAKLHCFQILANHLAFICRQRFEPLAHGFIATRGAIKANWQWTHIRHAGKRIICDTSAKAKFEILRAS